jgi:hypothetical protein
MCKKLMFVMLCVSLGMVLCGTAIASPVINGAVIKTRIFNDNPTSIVTTNNSYASSITINDDQRGSQDGGWANLHIFRLSADGGITAASFANGDAFEFAADVTITGTGNSEAGLNIAPWWSLDVDGRFMANSGGEIAVFGGRLPFYSFTADPYDLHYIKGDTIRMGVVYRPNSLSELDPATIEYLVTMAGTTYSSGPKPFDMGNPAEDPPHGLWGMLTPAQVGGYFQPQVGNTTLWEQVEFGNMDYVPEPATMTILALGSLFLARRRK